MKVFRGFVKIALFAEIYIIFSVICTVLAESFAEYESAVISVWYFATLGVWLAFAVIWASLILKINRSGKYKSKQKIIKRKE